MLILNQIRKAAAVKNAKMTSELVSETPGMQVWRVAFWHNHFQVWWCKALVMTEDGENVHTTDRFSGDMKFSQATGQAKTGARVRLDLDRAIEKLAERYDAKFSDDPSVDAGLVDTYPAPAEPVEDEDEQLGVHTGRSGSVNNICTKRELRFLRTELRVLQAKFYNQFKVEANMTGVQQFYFVKIRVLLNKELRNVYPTNLYTILRGLDRREQKGEMEGISEATSNIRWLLLKKGQADCKMMY